MLARLGCKITDSLDFDKNVVTPLISAFVYYDIFRNNVLLRCGSNVSKFAPSIEFVRDYY